MKQIYKKIIYIYIYTQYVYIYMMGRVGSKE